MSDQHRESFPLPGSERSPVAGARTMGPVAAEEQVQVTLVLRRREPLDVAALPAPLGRDELTQRFGAADVDVEAVTTWATAAGLSIQEVDAGSRRVRLAGPVALVAGAFEGDVEQAEVNGVQFRQRQGELRVPAPLGGIVVAILGLDDRPQARSRQVVAPRAAVTSSYTPLQLATVYRFPAGTDGSGQTIAIVELGGGYRDSELASYFDSVGLPPGRRPTVTAVSVDGAANSPSQDASGPDGEVLLDIEVAGALAPAAALVVYFAPNTDAGFLDAVSQAAHATPTPSAISISWGQVEDAWTVQARTAMDQAFADAAALGVTVTVAAGDDGSTDRAPGGGAHVDFPAASPHVLACGGTSLHADPTTGTVTSETVWNNGVGRGATGGGVSADFPLPAWQHGADVPPRAGTSVSGRGVPDVAAVADPRTGYQVLVDGQQLVIGGTSAVAPLWAALVARLTQRLGRRLGLAQPRLYAGTAPGTSPAGFRDIVAGSNGAYQARPGWDACTGLGVPDGEALLIALGAG